MSEKIKMEIERDLLLKLKSTNYEAYQLLNSLKLIEDLGYDYCQTLDIEKLKKECELGYFNVMDLFPKEKIIEAYLDYVNPVDISKSVSIGYKIEESKCKPLEIIGGQGLDVIESFVKWSEIVPDREIAGAYHIKKDPPKKHQALFDWINKNPLSSIKIKCDERSFLEIQKEFFARGIKWCSSGFELIEHENCMDILYDSSDGNIGLCFSGSHKYDSITEKFI